VWDFYGVTVMSGHDPIDIIDFTRKQYDPELDQANEPAEVAVYEHLRHHPSVLAVVRFPFGRYDIDMAYEADNMLWGAEVECRRKWWPEQDVEFAWSPIRVPLRKLRLAQKYKHKMRYFGVRADLKRAYTFSGEDILAGMPTKIGPHALGDEDEGFILLQPDAVVIYVDLA